MEAKMNKYDLVVTDNKTFVEYLREEGIVGSEVPVMKNARGRDVRHRNVIGKLSYQIAVQAKSYTEIPLNLPGRLVGCSSLIMEDYRKYAGKPVTYRVLHGRT